MLQALVSFAVSLGELRPLRRLASLRIDVVLFALGVAAITHCYSDADGAHRDVFKSKYLSVLDFVFGNDGFAKGAIRHNPSSTNLLHNLIAAKSRSHSSLLLSRPQSPTPRSQSHGSLGSLTVDPQNSHRRETDGHPPSRLSLAG
jgi:hypothetical protein